MSATRHRFLAPKLSNIIRPKMTVLFTMKFIFFQPPKSDKILEEDVQPAAGFRILKMSQTEWHYLLLGSIGAALTGSFPFVFALLLGELFGVSISILIKKMTKLNFYLYVYHPILNRTCKRVAA